jgi:hypothetical protein
LTLFSQIINFVLFSAQNTELSSVVHGTAESLINKLEENLSSAFAAGDGNTDQVIILVKLPKTILNQSNLT